MNKLVYAICTGSIALAVAASAAENNDGSPRVRRAKSTAATVQGTSSVSTNTGARVNRRNFQTNTQAQTGQRRLNATSNTNAFRHNRVRNDAQVSNQQNFSSNRIRRHSNNNISSTNDLNRVNRSQRFGRTNDLNSVNRSQRFDRANRNVTVNRNISRNRNVTIVNRWQGSRFSGQQYAAFRNYHRQWHDRDWYRRNNFRISFVFGAPYYWDSGYWYPAWGYNPGYSYAYDGPIYAYNNLAPDQVIVNVQEQLQQEGYYSGPIDGQLGPMTRQAIADFQADRGLAITSAVDQPTLASLGLV